MFLTLYYIRTPYLTPCWRKF